MSWGQESGFRYSKCQLLADKSAPTRLPAGRGHISTYFRCIRGSTCEGFQRRFVIHKTPFFPYSSERIELVVCSPCSAENRSTSEDQYASPKRHWIMMLPERTHWGLPIWCKPRESVCSGGTRRSESLRSIADVQLLLSICDPSLVDRPSDLVSFSNGLQDKSKLYTSLGHRNGDTDNSTSGKSRAEDSSSPGWPFSSF